MHNDLSVSGSIARATINFAKVCKLLAFVTEDDFFQARLLKLSFCNTRT